MNELAGALDNVDVWQEPPTGPTARGAQTTVRDFFAAVVTRLRETLPPDLAGFRHRANTMLLKIDYGNERVHYEVWTDSARGRIEIGLHFEDGPASTAAYLAYFDARIVEIKHLLGPQIDLERWTLSWDICSSRHCSRRSIVASRMKWVNGWPGRSRSCSRW